MKTLYILHTSHVHGKDVLLAFVPKSANAKTGNMVQVYILHPDMSPLDAVMGGQDDHVCGNCPQRWSLGGGCYVNVGQAPNSCYKAWERSGGVVDTWNDILSLCENRKVRLGAYGDPAHIGPEFIRLIDGVAAGVTGYTHQWRSVPELAGKLMASVETFGGLKAARRAGWKSFIVTKERPEDVEECESLQGAHCIDCMRCDGRTADRWIAPHGSLTNRHKSN